jgi:hypothetical protein
MSQIGQNQIGQNQIRQNQGQTNQNQNQNGRIDLVSSGTALFLQDQIKLDDKTNYYNTIKYSLEPSLLSKTFLSYENRIIIQNGIKAGVYKLSNQKYIIDKQDDDVLNSIMTGIYLQYALNKEDNIKQQVEDLNKMVIQYCVPKVFGEVKGYMQYKFDASTLVVPLTNPMSTYNSKELVLNNFF